MKNSAWYTKLWQTKMQELPIQGDENAAWQKMQGLLDQHMPVNSQPLQTKPGASLKIKLFYILAGVICIAVLYYMAGKTTNSHHKQQNKPIFKHAKQYYNTGDKNISDTLNSSYNDQAYVPTSGNAGNNKENSSNLTRITVQPPVLNKFNKNVSGASYNSTTALNTTSSISNKQITGSRTLNKTPVVTNSPKHKGNNTSNTTNTHLDKIRQSRNNYLKTSSRQAFKHVSAAFKNETQAFPKTNIKDDAANQTKTTNDAITADQTKKYKLSDTVSLTIKTNNLAAIKQSDTKQAQSNTSQKSAKKPDQKSKSQSSKKTADPGFVLDALWGVNTNRAANINPFVEISGSYNLNTKWGLSIGINVPSTKIISGSYSKSNLNYVTIGDSSKKITHNSGKLSISSTKVMHDIDIPVLAAYQLPNRFTLIAGLVLSIPIRSAAAKNKLGPLSSSADTTTLRTVMPYLTSTTINTKLNFGFSAGFHYTFNKFYLDASYLQIVSPYTISSGLGSGKIYYRTLQLGIGYHIFKARRK